MIARLLTLLLAVGLGALPAAASQYPYETGETVHITGIVTDADGRRLEGLEVILEASRLGVQVWPPGRVHRDVVRGSVRTDERGEFALDFTWSWRYNQFELLVAVPVRGPEGERLHILETVELNRRLREGSPVAVPVTLSDTRFLTNLRDFIASLDTSDQRRIYQERGKPDRVDRVQLSGRLEVSWWYFEQGKVYRFADGTLAKVEEFDPVEPL
jgi:hypothetical protein